MAACPPVPQPLHPWTTGSGFLACSLVWGLPTFKSGPLNFRDSLLNLTMIHEYLAMFIPPLSFLNLGNIKPLYSLFLFLVTTVYTWTLLCKTRVLLSPSSMCCSAPSFLFWRHHQACPAACSAQPARTVTQALCRLPSPAGPGPCARTREGSAHGRSRGRGPLLTALHAFLARALESP